MSYRLPVYLLCSVLSAYVGSFYTTEFYTSLFYTISFGIKEGLLLLLPFIIFSCMFQSINSISRDNSLAYTLLSLLAAIMLSNFISTNIAYFTTYKILGKVADPTSMNILQADSNVGLLYDLSLPKIINNETVLALGIIVGVLSAIYKIQPITQGVNFIHKISFGILMKVFIPLLPIFIFGFMLKMLVEGQAVKVVINASAYIIIGLLVLAAYLIFMLLSVSKLGGQDIKVILKNLVAPVATAFSSMSSAAALPLSITASTKNTNNPNIAQLVIPATVNIHLIGDSIIVPIIAFFIAYSYGIPLIGFEEFISFAIQFVLYKFAIAAVPAGGIIVMLPLLEKCLHFNAEMSALITTLYILLDPIITASNVFGNNLFCIFYNSIYNMRAKKA